MFTLSQRLRTIVHLSAILGLLLGALAACGTAAAPTPAPIAAAQSTATATLPPVTATGPAAVTPLSPTSEPGSGVVVEVTGGEFSFDSTMTTFTVNTLYRFMVKNAGVVPHEWLIEKVEAGAAEHAHTEHADLLGAISVDELGPGMTATREVVFITPGVYEFACRVPGHYEADMKQTITVQ